jgi:hypothetical protein
MSKDSDTRHYVVYYKSVLCPYLDRNPILAGYIMIIVTYMHFSSDPSSGCFIFAQSMQDPKLSCWGSKAALFIFLLNMTQVMAAQLDPQAFS